VPVYDLPAIDTGKKTHPDSTGRVEAAAPEQGEAGCRDRD